MIERFSGDHRFLSNFWREPDGSTVEHEYQAFKASQSTKGIGAILSEETPGRAKRAGAKAALHPLWPEIKADVMRFFVTKKFLDHPELAQLLVATGDRELIEGNTWHDNIWGRCGCKDCTLLRTHGAFPGDNLLGKILMEVRDLPTINPNRAIHA